MQDYDQSAKSYLAQNLNVIMSVWKMDQMGFAQLIGLNYPTFNNYFSLKTFPKIPTLLIISDVTGIPIDLLLRGLVPINLIPSGPLGSGEVNTSMVNERQAVYRTDRHPLIDYSELDRRLDFLEQQMKILIESANNYQK